MSADETGHRDTPRLVAPGVSYALAAAALFGASTPLAKLLVGQTSPVLLAGLLYLGSGAGLAILWLIRSRLGHESAEARLQASDVPWLAGAILSGGGHRAGAADGGAVIDARLDLVPAAQHGGRLHRRAGVAGLP